jgi:hypothetical protein
VGFAKMPENEWTWLALAPALIGTRDAPQRLQRAWLDGTLHLRGVPHAIPETHEVVEIPASEAGHLLLDCARSRIVRLSSQGRRQLTYYRSVQVKTADIERLAREARENRAANTAMAQAPSPPATTPPEQMKQNAAETLAPKATRLVRAVAAALRKEWPKGRPDIGVDGMQKVVHDNYPKTKIGTCSKTTVERAIRWLQEQRWGK